jgi:hypothetical protein
VFSIILLNAYKQIEKSINIDKENLLNEKTLAWVASIPENSSNVIDKTIATKYFINTKKIPLELVSALESSIMKTSLF